MPGILEMGGAGISYMGETMHTDQRQVIAESQMGERDISTFYLLIPGISSKWERSEEYS